MFGWRWPQHFKKRFVRRLRSTRWGCVELIYRNITKIHLSRYHYELFMSLKQIGHWTNGPYLGGFKLGNTTQEAIITTNPEVRIHSCERDLGCPGLNKKNVVYITPIIAHIDDKEVTEAGLDFGDREFHKVSLTQQTNGIANVSQLQVTRISRYMARSRYFWTILVPPYRRPSGRWLSKPAGHANKPFRCV